MRFERLPIAGGPYRHLETYFEYDGPQTFALESTRWDDTYVVGNTVGDDEERGIVTTLFVLLGGDRFRAMRSGQINFHEIFTGAWPGDLWVGDSRGPDYIEESVRSIEPKDLPNEWLPARDVALRIPTATAAVYEPGQVKRLAESRQSTTLALKVQDPKSNATTFPTKSAGQIQVALDSAITAISRALQGLSPRDRDHGVRTNVLELRAASFVVIMAVDMRGRLYEDVPHSHQVMERVASFMNLVESGDTEALFAFMKAQESSVRNRLRDLLTPISDNKSGMGFDAALPGVQEVYHSRATKEAVESAVVGLSEAPPVITHRNIERGLLTGLVIRTRRFEVVDLASGMLYKGIMTADATVLANNFTVGDSSYVSATIRVATPFFNDEDDLTGVKHTLEFISLWDDGMKS